MRNLKRALSLTLASVMLLGMMVVGSNAAAGYDDVKETDNVEAIEVLQAVEVMVGDERGFGPDRPVSRAEMAVVMGKLLNLDYNYYVSTCPFTDVSGNYDWAKGWVGAAAANGIVSGRGDGVYDPAATVTAVEAASMMMRALGYFQYKEDYEPSFQLSTVKQGSEIGIFDGVGTDGNTAMTRNQVARMALNALRSEMVTFTGTPAINVNGVSVGYRAEYTPRTSTESKYNAIEGRTSDVATEANHKGQYYIQLGEQLYDGKLKLDNDAYDVFGRPSRKWEYDGKGIGTYAKTELMVMEVVGKVTGNDLYTKLGSSTIDKYAVQTTVDGVSSNQKNAKDILGWVSASKTGAYFDADDMNRDNKAAVGATGTGTLTQVFVDHAKDKVDVAVINTYLARATRDYDDKGEEANLTVYGLEEKVAYKELVKAKGESKPMTVEDEDFDLVKDVKKDDSYLVTVAEGAIQSMVPAEVLEGVTLTAFKQGDHVVSDGTEYKYTTTATYNKGDLDQYTKNGVTNLKDITYNIYLDAYGNLIGIKEVDAVKNYVFIAGIDVDGSNLANKSATANALFLDGTSKTIKINMAKSVWTAHKATLDTTHVDISGHALLNTWATYTVSKDGVYTVTEVDTRTPDVTKADLAQFHQTTMPANHKVDVKRMRLLGGGASGKLYANVYGDSTSVYLIPELDELRDTNKWDDITYTPSFAVIKDVDTVTTGIADTSITVWTRDEARDAADNTKDNTWTIPGSSKVTPSNVPAKTTADYWISYGIYTLYDDEGIVIAAVVVGENEGVKDLVYVHSDKLSLESYNSAEDEWTWTRDVIFNGEEVTLTEKGSEVSYLENMAQYHWYEIKRNTSGEVLKAIPAYDKNALGSYRDDPVTPAYPEGTPDTTYKDTFVNLYKDINWVVENTGEDTVLYQTAGGPEAYGNDDPSCHLHSGLNKKLDVIGSNTLAVETEEGSGIHFRDNVNVVLQYWNKNTEQEEIETGTGVDRLKSMVDFVNANNAVRGNDGYYLSALIEKGFATTIVIYDSYNNYNRPEQDLPAQHLNSTASIATVNEALTKGNVTIDGRWQPADLLQSTDVNANVVKIPANTTLTIDGDFIAYNNRGNIKVNSGNIHIEDAKDAKLVVNGTFELADQTLSCDTTVTNKNIGYNMPGNMVVHVDPRQNNGRVELQSAVSVAGNMRVSVDDDVYTGSILVTKNADVKVSGNITTNKAITVNIYGHLEVAGSDVNTFEYNVYSDETLVMGRLYGTLNVFGTGRAVIDDLTPVAVTLYNGARLVIDNSTDMDKFTVVDATSSESAAATITFGKDAYVCGKTEETENTLFVTSAGTEADVADKTFTLTSGYLASAGVTADSDGVVTEITKTNTAALPVQPENTPNEPGKDNTGSSKPTEPEPPVTAKALKSLTITGINASYADAASLPKTATVKGLDADGKDVTGLTATIAWGKPDATTGKVTGTVTVSGLNAQTQKIDATTTVTGGTNTNGKITVETTVSTGSAGESETVITKIEQTGTAGSYTFTITYTGPTPDFTTEAGRKLVLDALKEKYPEIAMTSMVGAVVYNGDDPVGTVVLSGLFKVYGADGKALTKIDGTEYTFTGAESQGTKETLPVTGSGYLVNKDDPTEGYEIKTAVSSYIEFEPNGAEADVYLVAGYQLPSANVNNTITKVEYNNETVTTKAATYFPKTAVLTLTGTVKTGANSNNYTEVWLTVGGSKVGSNKTVGDNANTYTLDLSTLTDSQLENNAIKTIAEAGAAVTTIKIGSFENKFEGALTAPVEITILPSMVAEAAKVVSGNYVIKTDNMADYADSNATVIAVTNDGSKITIGAQSDSLSATENVLELVPMTQVTFKFAADSATAKFSVGFDTETLSTGAGEDWYFKTGVQFKPEYTVNGKTAKISAIVVDDQDNKVRDVTISSNGLITVDAMAEGEDHVVVTFLEEIEEITLTGVALGDDHTTLGTIVSNSTGIKLSGNGSANWTDASKTLTFKVEAKEGYCFASEVTINDVAAEQTTHGYSNASASAPDANGIVTITCTVSEPTG